MTDSIVRQGVDQIPVPRFEQTAWTQPPPLDQARVAIVTSAGLQRPGEKTWGNGDQSFRVFPRDERSLTTSHLSNNWDRSGIVADLNVAYPIDRLEELAEDGVVGSVAPRHLSFMGALDETLSTLRQDTGPAAAKTLLEDGVEVVLLTPV